MSKISSSSDRFTFSKKRHEEILIDDPDNTLANDMLNFYNNMRQNHIDQVDDVEWQKNNLEYDLRSTNWILEKARASETYSQNLYAALCNNSFIKKELWPILKDEKWSCSWRYAGGIIADMREEGDYIDWYCSGIQETKSDYHSVPESIVTEEIENDLNKLGWIVIKDDT